MVDLGNEDEVVALFVHRPGGRRLVASTAGDGFLLPEDQALAQTRTGRQVLNVKEGVRAALCRPVAEDDDHVAVIGENRKMLVFPLSELPEMGRGKGVRLQKYKDGGLSDARTLRLADGLSWQETGGRTRQEGDLTPWLAKRASPGRMAPRGFPRDNRFPGGGA
jgi:topoisomerase-4 subunit A